MQSTSGVHWGYPGLFDKTKIILKGFRNDIALLVSLKWRQHVGVHRQISKDHIYYLFIYHIYNIMLPLSKFSMSNIYGLFILCRICITIYVYQYMVYPIKYAHALCIVLLWFYNEFQVMMMSSNGNIFRVTGPSCREFTGHQWIPHTEASDTELDVFFELCRNNRLSKQSLGRWFETPSHSLWHHCNGIHVIHSPIFFRVASLVRRQS